MPPTAVILTTSKGFGELIRQVLADSATLKPVLLSDPVQAIATAQSETVGLLILDAEQSGIDLVTFVGEFRTAAPNANIVVIPAEDAPNDALLEKLQADTVLPSPFYLPNLVTAIEHHFGPLNPKPQPKQASYGSPPTSVRASEHRELAAPSWLQDVSLAAQFLARLSLESASQAALITRGDKVWAYAGELPQKAAEELAGMVSRHFEKGDGADLARFIHVDTTRSDHMLYATSLGDDFMLALVFDAQVPFSQMRAQVNKLANALVTAPEREFTSEASQTRGPAQVRLERRDEDRSEKTSHGFSNPIPRADLPSARHARVSATGTLRLGGQTGQLEPPAPVGNELRYSYALLPRLPNHRLEGDLAVKLTLWLPQLCLAFAWRLESISVQAANIQWTVSTPPDVSPETVVNTLEKHLSERIFEEFPRLKRENPSGKFFAQGFFVVNGAQPSPEEISEFVQQTRARQGLNNPN